MPNFEKLQLPIEPEPTQEVLVKIHDLREGLDSKIKTIDDALRTLEEKMNSKTILRNERAELASSFNTLEQSKKDLIKNNIPVVQAAPSLLVDQYGGPIHEQSVEPVTFVDQYGNPMKKEPVSIVQAEPVVNITTTVSESESNPEPAPAPAPSPEPAPVQKTPAQLLAEKIRNLDKTGEILTPEDFEFRTQHWPEVSEALLELSKKEAESAQPETAKNFIEMGKPTLERLTMDYGDALFKNKSVIRNGFDAADPLVRDHLKKLSEEYHQSHFAEVQKIHESKGSIADQMTFYKQQSEKLAQEIMKRENEEMKKRVGKAASKTVTTAGNVLLYLTVFGAQATKAIWEKGKNLAGAGLDKAKEWWNKPTPTPKTLKERLMEKFQLTKKATPTELASEKSPEEKKNVLAEKYGKTNQQKVNQRIELQKKMKELEDQRALEKKTTETIENILGKKLEGDTQKKWERLGKITIVGFFNPTTKLGKKLEDYPEDARKIYDRLIPIYQRDLTSDPKMNLRDYITQLVKEKDI